MSSIIRLPEVERRTALSGATIYKLMAEDAFPKSVKIGNRSVGWVEAEIDQYVADKIAASRGEAVP